MKTIAQKRKMRQVCGHFLHTGSMGFLLFCIFGILASIPIFAQKKPLNVQLRSVSNSVPSGYTQVGNTMLYYRQTSSSIDVQGCYNGLYYGSTFSNGGYRVAMQVNNGAASQVDCLNGSTISGVSFFASIEPQGELARMCYSITNTNQADVVVSLGTHADVMIGNNDSAPISRRIDTTGNTYGVTMKDGNGAQLCVLFGSGLAGVTSVNDYWFGYYGLNRDPNQMVGNYSSGSYYMVENGSYDSGMGWCWKNRTIPAGATVVFSYLIGVGDVNLEPNSSFEVMPDDPEGWNDLSRPHKLALEGTYESPAGLDGMIEYAIEDSEEWKQLTAMLPSGSTFCDTLVAMFDATREKHIIRFRTVDNVGNATMLPSIEYKDVSFYPIEGITGLVYSGDSLFQESISCELSEDEYVVCKYSNNINVGTASFNVEGLFPYTIGRRTYNFNIQPQPLSGMIIVEGDDYVYDGNAKEPNWCFSEDKYSSLEESTDFTFAYENNTLPGTASVIVRGKGNYTSELTGTFIIDKATLRDNLYNISVPQKDISYDGKSHGAVVTSEEGVGSYTIQYAHHGQEDFTTDAPVDEGIYDVYVSFAEGSLYYGMEQTLVGKISIYKFSEAEWASLKAFYAQVASNNVVWAQKWQEVIATDDKLSVGTLDGLTIEKGHVVGIDLANQNLTGQFPTLILTFPQTKAISLAGNHFEGDVQNIIQELFLYISQKDPLFLSELESLNLSGNELLGNIGLLGYSTETVPSILSRFPRLSALNASANHLTNVYPYLPSTIVNLDLSCQATGIMVDLDLSNVTVDNIPEDIPTILIYNHQEQSYNTDIYLRASNYPPTVPENQYISDKEFWGIDVFVNGGSMGLNCLADNAYKGQSGDTLYVSYPHGSSEVSNSYCLTRFCFSQGDVNFKSGVDITDLQATINYAFGLYETYPFNFTAADTYKDDRINVQDVVCTANIIIDSDQEEMIQARAQQKPSTIAEDNVDALVFVSNGKVVIETSKPVAALDLIFEGNVSISSNLEGLDYNVMTKESHGSKRMLAYTLSDQFIPVGRTVIAEYIGANPTVTRIKLAAPDAQAVSAAFADNTTNISNIDDILSEDAEYYDMGGIRIEKPRKGFNIVKTSRDGEIKTNVIYIK